MMKLFLSSIRLPNHDEQIQLFGDKKPLSVAIIPNAWDTYPKDRQESELANTVAQFKELGFKITVIDLVTSNTKVADNLKPFDFAWIMGGNTFYLNYRVQKTGFDQTIKNAVKDGLVYGGTSAGAVITGPTIHGAEHVDDPKDAPQLVWGGLGLVDFGIVPHWGTDKYKSELEKMKDELKQYVAKVFTITNDQAIICIDDKIEVR